MSVNSVAGQLVGIPVGQVYTAGHGITIEGNSLNREVSLDETVLYEDSDGTSVSTFVLSEGWNNFETVRFIIADAYGWGTNQYDFLTSGVSVAGTRAKHFPCVRALITDKMIIRQIQFSFANNDYVNGTVESSEATIKDGEFPTFTTTSIASRLIKVVGINRISGGN